MKKLLLIVFAVLSVLLILYFTAERAMIFAISKSFGIDVSYSSVKNDGFSEFIFRGLKVTDAKTGFGAAASYAAIKPKIASQPARGVDLDVDLKDIEFIKTSLGEKEEYTAISEIVAAPFASKWKYKEVSASLRLTDGGLKVSDFMATGDSIRFSFKGDIFRNNTVDGEMTVYFSQKLVKKVPDPLIQEVLKDESSGWKSLSVKVKGDYKAPAIEILSNKFRFTVKEIVVSQ